MDKMVLTIKQGFALPKKELTVFNGDPLEYWNFIKSFENSIVSNEASESEKLMYLLQYTSGVAKDTIKCCLVMDSSLGYRKARELLEERFGHPFTIASKYVTKLTEGPPLKPWDRAGLLAFADKLKDCEHTLESIGYLEEINSADNLRRIVQRLPFHLRTKREDDCLMHQLQRFWEAENSGVIPESKVSMSVEDKEALAIMEQSVKLEHWHYQIALPWKQFPPFLPYNRFIAERRLQTLKNRLLLDSELLENYKATIEQYLSKGHARRVPLNEINVQDKPLWYLPHHPVLNKPGKTRVVFDCAAKHKGTSLNDQLITGPDLTNSIVGVLMRFREEQVALSADIECMFHQIRVAPDDRDAFRFLWWRDGELTQQPIDHRMEVHLFGATSSPSGSSFALRRTAKDNKDEFSKNVVRTVKRNFYVDDCLKSVKSVEDAVEIVDRLREILSKGGFRLTKCSCNRSEVLDTIPQAEKAQSVVDLDLDKDKLPTYVRWGSTGIWRLTSSCSRLLLKTDQTPVVVYYP